MRTPQGWRITERINANLDGTAEHRDMLAPPAARRPPPAAEPLGPLGPYRNLAEDRHPEED